MTTGSWVRKCSRCSKQAVLDDVASIVSAAVNEMNALLEEQVTFSALPLQADVVGAGTVPVSCRRPLLQVTFGTLPDGRAGGGWHLQVGAERTNEERFESTAKVYWDCRRSERRLLVGDYLVSLEEFVQRALAFAFFQEVPVVPLQGPNTS